jgi:hypothetical protein
MNAANSGEPTRGVVVGRLNESHPDRIVVGSSILYLREGVPCAHAVGTFIGVTYTTEQDGRRLVESLEPMGE